MRLVISDTGPINYLVLIGHIEILPVLFEKVIMPIAVLEELTNPDTPPSVRAWIANPPVWLDVQETSSFSDDNSLSSLDDGEKAAIALAIALRAELLLMDDREGVLAARHKGLAVTGTVGVLDMAAQRSLLDLSDAFARLRYTNFRCPEAIMEGLLIQRQKM